MNTSTPTNQSFALAFAVAAMQHKQSPEHDRMPNSFFTEQRNTDRGMLTKTPSYATESTAGSLTEDHPQFSRHASFEEEEDSFDQKLEKSRERNREHARRTRIRKKEHLESLQSKVKELELERKNLQQKIEECNIASILLGMSSNNDKDGEEPQIAREVIPSNTKNERVHAPPVVFLTEGKRKRFFVENSEFQVPSEPLKVSIDGQLTILGGGCHVNWKTGMYSDNHGLHKKLTQEQLQKLRRERNRMHAKLTRDRKKCFISVLEKTIEDLASDNANIRETLARVSVFATAPGSLPSQIVTPSRSPLVSPSLSHQEIDNDDVSAYSMDVQHT